MKNKEGKYEWAKIRAEYFNTSIGIRPLAAKYNISASSLLKRSAKEGWAESKRNQGIKIEVKLNQKLVEKISTTEANRLAKLMEISDKLVEKIEQAITEIGQYYTVKKESIGYDEVEHEGAMKRVPIKETATMAKEGKSTVSTTSLRDIASALKSIRDLTKVSPDEAGDDKDVTVVFEGDTEDASG